MLHTLTKTGLSSMQSTFARTAQIVAILVLAAAVTQALYTALYMAEVDVPRTLLWGGEGLIFVLTAAFAGSALAQASRLHLVWSAITAAAVLNVVQVGVGLTMFGPFREAAQAVPEMAPAASGIVAFSFMVYNAAKVLLALALIVLALDKLGSGAKALGGVSALIGVIALVSNTLSMALGRGFSGELPIAGSSGVLATVLLAVCLFTLPAAEAD
ncbi:MAG: thiamine biosynthesis protein ThiC [Pseudomonadota bacterium]